MGERTVGTHTHRYTHTCCLCWEHTPWCTSPASGIYPDVTPGNLQPLPSTKSAFYIRLDSSCLPTGLLDSRLRVPGSPELRLVIVSRVPEKGAFRSVLVGVWGGGGNYRIKHTTTTLWEFLTRKHFWFCVSFVFYPSRHTQDVERKYDAGLSSPRAKVWTLLPVKLRHESALSARARVAPHSRPRGPCGQKGMYHFQGHVWVTCARAVLARATRGLTFQKVQTQLQETPSAWASSGLPQTLTDRVT